MSVVRWRIRDLKLYWEAYDAGLPLEPHEYVFHINPNEGGSPQIEKSMNYMVNTGPRRSPLMQEGRASVPMLQFSGVILTREHYLKLEEWYSKRIALELIDDLGRTFRGVLTAFSPERVRRTYNPWYHTYSATFAAGTYSPEEGVRRY